MINSQDTIIAVDAMGGDNAPNEIIKGVAKTTVDTNIKILLTGNEKTINNILSKTNHNKDQIQIIHTDEFITNDESPRQSIKKKPKSSMLIATELCGKGEAHGIVSAGNTGAYILAAVKNIDRIHGVNKTAIASVYPTRNKQKHNDIFSLMLDVGANNVCSAEDLVQFALMGKIYSSDIKGINNPTVALLNNGRESHKGGEIMSKTYSILEALDSINFIGNIEGNDIMQGLADVVVTNGFVGNIVVKTIEGISDTLLQLGKYASKKNLLWMFGMMALSGGIKQLKAVTDYAEYGGAPILGFKKIVIKAHGKSNALAISNAIKVAAKTYRDDVCKNIEEQISKTKLNINFN